MFRQTNVAIVRRYYKNINININGKLGKREEGMSKYLWCCIGRIIMEGLRLIILTQRDDFTKTCTAVLYYQVLVLLF